MLCSCLQSECAFGEIMRRWSILTAPLQHDLATAMLIFRVCCKLHNFCIAERDTFSGMTGAADDMSGHTMVGAVPRPNPVQLTGGDEPMPRNLHGRQSSKVRRHAWMLALKWTGLEWHESRETMPFHSLESRKQSRTCSAPVENA